MTRCIGVFTSIWLFAVPALAQVHSWEVVGGHTLLGAGRSVHDTDLYTGWLGSFGWAASDSLVMVGEASGHRAVEAGIIEFQSDVYAFLGGPRYRWRYKRITLFGQGLAGAVRLRDQARADGLITLVHSRFDPNPFFDPGQTHPAAQFGVGVDTHLSDHWLLRFQGDYRRVFNLGFNQARFVTAIAYTFG